MSSSKKSVHFFAFFFFFFFFFFRGGGVFVPTILFIEMLKFLKILENSLRGVVVLIG